MVKKGQSQTLPQSAGKKKGLGIWGGGCDRKVWAEGGLETLVTVSQELNKKITSSLASISNKGKEIPPCLSSVKKEGSGILRAWCEGRLFVFRWNEVAKGK